MAYLFNNMTDEELQKLQNDPNAAPTGGGQETGGALLGTDGATSPNATAAGGASSAPVAKSSGWTNLRSYLDANQEQAMDIANRIAGGITSQGDAAKSAIDTAGSKYKSDVGQYDVNPDQGLVSRAAASPENFVGNASDVGVLKKMGSASYGGPGTFESTPDYADASAKAEEASKLPTLAQNAGGYRGLIQKLNPGMGTGQVDLNELIVSGNPGAATTLTSAAEPYAKLKEYLGDTAKSVNSERDRVTGNVSKARDMVKTGFTDPENQFYDKLTNYFRGISGGEAPTLRAYGQDAARILALQNLLGRSDSDFTPDSPSDYGSFGKVATMKDVPWLPKGAWNYW